MNSHPISATLPRQFKFWPDDKISSPAEIRALYEQGYAGAFQDPVATEKFESFIDRQSFGNLNGAEVANANGLAGSGEGRLIIPFTFVEKLLPGCWPGAAQERGDCVSHSTKNAALLTMVCDIVSGKPDEVTGKMEGLPEIDPMGIKQGALSTEAIYWYRGYSGDGWSCEDAARVACEESALWPRRDYPELGVNLTKYSGSLAGKYGRSAPPSNFTSEGQKHLIRTSTRVRGKEVRDFLANGYGISSCGGEAWSATRDANGFSKRSGRWSHALGIIGYDDRDIIKAIYGQALWLILNSWGKWNSGPRRILGTEIDIPEGSFWALESACVNRSNLAFSGASGWPAKSLPPYQLLMG